MAFTFWMLRILKILASVVAVMTVYLLISGAPLRESYPITVGVLAVLLLLLYSLKQVKL